MNILDCTLRDGGYYNKWDFDPIIVKAYLTAMAKSNIDYVELGLRSFPKEGFLGAFAYTTENFLNSITLPAGPTYGVMVDAKTILESGLDIDLAIEALFVTSSQSKIDLVRVAAHFKEVEFCGAIVKKLKTMGYIVGFNLMQAGGKSEEVIAEKAHIASEWQGLDVLYFADSLGNMDAAEVVRIVNALRKKWPGPLGIHTHNNMGKGVSNTLAAYTAGVTWLDSTVTGMGRGAGNTQTENLLAVLEKTWVRYVPEPVYDLVVRYFESMQKDYGWGSNLLYFLGAQNNVHPTYIQNLLADTHYGTEELIGAISYLSKLEGTESYSGNVLDAALNINAQAESVTGSDELSSLFINQEVLIVSNGPSLQKYLPDVQNYILHRKPIVVAVNMIEQLNNEFIDYYCVSHNTKFLSESSKYISSLKPIILPKHRFTAEEQSNLPVNILDFGLAVEADFFQVDKTYCTTPYDLTIAYAIAATIAGGSNNISLVCADGYDANDTRQLEMNKLIEIIKDSAPLVKLTSITPTSYALNKGSIYAPNI